MRRGLCLSIAREAPTPAPGRVSRVQDGLVSKMLDPYVIPMFPGDKLGDGLRKWRERCATDPAPLTVFPAVRACCTSLLHCVSTCGPRALAVRVRWRGAIQQCTME